MKEFHIGDVLSVTTGMLVSPQHIGGVYSILNFLTGDNLFTHQLPRAMRECTPWLRTQFPQLMGDSPEMKASIKILKNNLAGLPGALAIDKEPTKICAAWVEDVRRKFNLPEMLPVYEMGADMHTHIDPIEEAKAMVGDEKVIVVEPRE